jgi:NAD-dependent dihydropyrimidine dehydrogenase PreA subunit
MLQWNLEGGIVIKIDQDKCAGCMDCIPYCPLSAIKENDMGAFPTAVISQEECVECGACLRSGSCKVGAIWWPELEWPRAVRQAFSAVLIGYGALRKAGVMGYDRPDSGGGRGTNEMKTNDITGRYKHGEVGIAAEMGRPCQGFYFRDLEKVTMAMSQLGAEFEPENPLTALLDEETGRIKHREVINERAMSAIVEMKVGEERAVEVLQELRKVSKEIDTVFTVDIINKCKDGMIPVKPTLEKAGIRVRINGKTNVGLGRPLAE